jgi:hypothetical protein
LTADADGLKLAPADHAPDGDGIYGEKPSGFADIQVRHKVRLAQGSGIPWHRTASALP